jgi:tetratricopeptide (TPR) repeat protein
VDTRTRHALKQDKFAAATASSVSWLTSNRSAAMPMIIGVAAAVVLLIGGLIYWNVSSTHADSALGAALDSYDAPLAQPGAPAEAGVFSSASERSKAANQMFAQVAKDYSWLSQGAKAHYFEGLTAQELGQNAQAESELKIAAGSWDRNLSNLAKIALANLYHQTGRDSEAVDLYNAVAAKPSETVTVSMAQLNLAGMYASEGKMDQARTLWAKVKDGDKDGAAGQIATQKLGGRQ